MIITLNDFRFLQQHIQSPELFPLFSGAEKFQPYDDGPVLVHIKLDDGHIDMIIADIAPLVDADASGNLGPLGQRASDLIDLLTAKD